jgi:hypothetical protein
MKQVLRPGENNALGEMVAVYGDDYQAMARDIKRTTLAPAMIAVILSTSTWTNVQLRG